MKYDNHFMLSLFHIVIIAPLLLFIGFQRADTPIWLYHTSLVLGLIILLYHGFRLMLRLRDNSGYAWVNLIHILFVAPLLIYIGYHKKETPRSAYEMMMMLGFAAVGYHLFSLVRNIEIHAEP